MTLQDDLTADTKAILEDDITGFGWPMTVTNPVGFSAQFVGQYTDIAEAIDPETGQSVSSRTVTVALMISSLLASELGIPQGVSDKTQRPWVVELTDRNGSDHRFKVMSTKPDASMGVVVLELEFFRL